MNSADRRHLAKIAALGCIVCRNSDFPDSPAEIHHLRSGAGLSQRSDHKRAIPLCHIHHRTGGHGVAIHAGIKTWEEKFGTEEELLAQVHGLIGYEPSEV